MKKTKFKLLPLSAALLACGLGMSSGAQANAYAVSANNIREGLVTPFFNGVIIDTTLPGSPIVFGDPNSLSSSSATLNGVGESKSDAGPTPDAGASNGTGSVPLRTNEDTTVSGGGNTYYDVFGQAATNYSGGDAIVVSEQTVTGTPIEARNVAESNIVTTGFADADGRNVSSTSLQLPISVGTDCASGACTVNFAFLADPFIQTILDAGADAGSVARGVLSVGVSIREVGALVDTFAWGPNGAPGGIVGGIENTDGTGDGTQSLNLTVTQLTAGTTEHSPGYAADSFNRYDATTFALLPGNYVLSLSMIEKTDVGRNAVPEPATLALVGLGILGMGFASRRRKQA